MDILSCETKVFLETFDLLRPVGWHATHDQIFGALTNDGLRVRQIEKRGHADWEIALGRVADFHTLADSLLLAARVHRLVEATGLIVNSESIRVIAVRYCVLLIFQSDSGYAGRVQYKRSGQITAQAYFG